MHTSALFMAVHSFILFGLLRNGRHWIIELITAEENDGNGKQTVALSLTEVYC